MSTYPQNKIKAIQEDLKTNEDDSYEDIAIRNNVENWVVEFIEEGLDPNNKEEESNCSFCGEPTKNTFCSSECKTAEHSEFT